MNYTKITIADILRAIKYKPETNGGICGQRLINLWLSPRNYALMKDAMCEWPKRSECRVYPVPQKEGISCASMAQMEYMRLREKELSLWDANTEYGALRWELLEWLIKHPDLQRPLWKRGKNA